MFRLIGHVMSKSFKSRVLFGVVCIICSILAYNSIIAEQKADIQIDKFSSYYEVGTDGYCIDTIMYENPSWSYDKAEDRLFMSDSAFTAKYGE